MEDAGISWNRDCSNRSCDWNTGAFCNGGKYSRKLSEGLRKEYGGMGNMQQGANEVMYKIASHLLSKMQESGLISEEEREKINVLNIETFSGTCQSISVIMLDIFWLVW